MKKNIAIVMGIAFALICGCIIGATVTSKAVNEATRVEEMTQAITRYATAQEYYSDAYDIKFIDVVYDGDKAYAEFSYEKDGETCKSVVNCYLLSNDVYQYWKVQG